MKKLLLLFSFILAMFVANSQTYVKDSVSQFRLPLSAGSFVFDKGAGIIYQIQESAAATDSLVSISRIIAANDTLRKKWALDIHDSILSNKRTFSEILKENNSAGDNSITRVRSLSDLTSSVTDSYASGIAFSGSTLGGAGIAMQGSTIYGTGVGISGTNIDLNSKAIGISANFINSTGVAMHSKLDSINGLSLSYDTLRGVNQTDSSIFVSVGGYKNLIYNNDTSKTHVSTTLINSDTSTVSSSSNFVGINLQNKTYEDLNNTTVIDRNLLLPGVVSSNAPASVTDTGIKGEIRITADYIYVCIDTDTWVRSALSTW